MTLATDLVFVSALEQGRLIRTREVSPVELAQAYIDRIETHNPALGAYLTVTADHALAAAKEAEASLDGEDLSPLYGVCVSIKDLIDTAGIRTTHGVSVWNERVPDTDAEVVKRSRGAGLVMLGKTNTPEFGSSIVSEPPGYPPARNPWNIDLSPGGSSGGAAAALAAGLCAISLGSDGGGSIRIPSSWCGLVGLKPSRGRVSDAPSPQHWYGHSGPIARTVADAAALLDSISGYATGDAFWLPKPKPSLLEETDRQPGRLRVAVSTTHPNASAQTDPANRRAAEETAALLSDLGHEVVEATPPSIDMPMAMIIAAGEHAARPEQPPVEAMEPINQMLQMIAKNTPAAELARAMNEIQRASREVISFFDDYDVLLTPTVAGPPPKVGEFSEIIRERPHEVTLILDRVPFTPTWNQTGQPAISLPLFTDGNGFPVGVQIVGRPAEESTLVRLGSQLEAALPWHERRPPGF